MKHTMAAFLAGSTMLELKEGEGDDPAGLVTRALDEFRTTVEERLKAVEAKADITKLVERIDGLEAKAQRPPAAPKAAEDERAAMERKAFQTYLHLGATAPPDELKALTVSSDAQGGYLAPAEFSSEFIRDLVEYSPVRAVASVRTTGAGSVIYPTRGDVTNARWHGETQTTEESEISMGQLEVPVKEISTFVDISNRLLADSGGMAEAEVRAALAEDFGQKEALAFVMGDGVQRPSGFMQHPGILHTVNGHAANLSSDKLIELLYSLPAAYRLRGSWAMNGTTLARVRQLKDGLGNYLWQPSYQAGQPETLLSRPVVEMVDMPDIADGAFPIVYGDFGAYRIIDRTSMTTLVDPYSRATNGITRIHATRRVGGAVIQAARFRKLKTATS